MSAPMTTPRARNRPLARLALMDGTIFNGQGFGACADAADVAGEVVFNTAITGYEEVLSDPSYRGQLVVMTAPQIGNVGWNLADLESTGARAAGFVVRELSPVHSNWRSQVSLDEAMATAGVPGICGVDTRLLTRVLREQGAESAVLSFASPQKKSDAELVSQARSWGGMVGRDLVSEVTCAAPYRWTEPSLDLLQSPGQARARPPRMGDRGHVVVYDFGVKRNILRQLCDLGMAVTVVPANFPFREALTLSPDGFLLSNGPGDPAAVSCGVAVTREVLDSGKPILGICLGHQILGLALGGTTYKLKFGHHGINHPVKDLQSGRVEITSQNHGFAVDLASLAGRAVPSHINLNDNTVEGMALPGRKVLGIQYHPEAAPGPHDASYLFQRFAQMIAGQGS